MSISTSPQTDGSVDVSWTSATTTGNNLYRWIDGTDWADRVLLTPITTASGSYSDETPPRSTVYTYVDNYSQSSIDIVVGPPPKPWCHVYIGGEEGTGAVDFTDYVAEGLSISGGASKPFERPDATVAAFQVITTTSDTITRPELGAEVIITGAPPANSLYDYDNPRGVYLSWWPLFFGFVSDVSEQQLEPDGLTVWTVNAVDSLAVMAGVAIGAAPWPISTVADRVNAVETAVNAALGSPWWVDIRQGNPPASDYIVHYRDVDNVRAFDALYSYLDAAHLSVLHTYMYNAGGPYHPGVIAPSVWQYASPRLVTEDVTWVDPAQIPKAWVKYGPRDVYSKETTVTQWDVTYGPANESQLVTNATVGTNALAANLGPTGSHDGRFLRYQFTHTSTAADEPAAGQALYYDGTDTGSTDPTRLRVHRTDSYGRDNTARLRNTLNTGAVSIFPVGLVPNGPTYYMQGGAVQTDPDYFDLVISSKTSGWAPTSYSPARLHVPHMWPQASLTAADTTVPAGRRRIAAISTEYVYEHCAQRVAHLALGGSRSADRVMDQVQVLQLPNMDYTLDGTLPGVTGSDLCYETLWKRIPSLIQGGGIYAGLVIGDYSTDPPTDVTAYYALGGTLTSAQDGWALQLQLVPAAVYSSAYRPDLHHITTLDKVTLT